MTEANEVPYVISILSYWDANAYYPEDAPNYIDSLNTEERDILKRKLRNLEESPDLAKFLSRVTAFDIKTNSEAKSFILNLEAYLFSGGGMPDIG